MCIHRTHEWVYAGSYFACKFAFTCGSKMHDIWTLHLVSSRYLTLCQGRTLLLEGKYNVGLTRESLSKELKEMKITYGGIYIIKGLILKPILPSQPPS